jgi:hypothetical protein
MSSIENNDKRLEIFQGCLDEVGYRVGTVDEPKNSDDDPEILLDKSLRLRVSLMEQIAECPAESYQGYSKCVDKVYAESSDYQRKSEDLEKAKYMIAEQCAKRTYKPEKVVVVDFGYKASRSASMNYNGLLLSAKKDCYGKLRVLENEY